MLQEGIAEIMLSQVKTVVKDSYILRQDLDKDLVSFV